MKLSTDIWDLNDIIAKLLIETDAAGQTDYAENLNRAVQYLERAVGFLEEADRVQPILKAVQ